MARVNPSFGELQANYLFREIGLRTAAFQVANPEATIYKLGIGDVKLGLSPSAISGLHGAVDLQANSATFTGYGDVEGRPELRTAIANLYRNNGIGIEPEDIFVGDGAKTATADIQSIFHPESKVAVQDPVYPVYVNASVINGKTSGFENGRYKGLVYMDCTEENEFFPEVPKEKVDLIYLCSPNNPTGTVATHEQLKKFVDYAHESGAVIIFDAAYSAFISDGSLPRSIYEIEGAKSCAIEINSFSKTAGFTGERLGWTIIPHELVIEGSEPGEVQDLWRTRQNNTSNGASNIVQRGGLQMLSETGQKEIQQNVLYYMKNAKAILHCMGSLGITAFGGVDAPYVWLQTPGRMSSWDFFHQLLTQARVEGTPGEGFGHNGKGYFRLSAFGLHENVQAAVESIKQNLRI